MRRNVFEPQSRHVLSDHCWILAKLPCASFPASPLTPSPHSSSPPTPSPSETEPCLSAVAEVWRSAPPAHASSFCSKTIFSIRSQWEWMDGGSEVSFFFFFSPLGCKTIQQKKVFNLVDQLAWSRTLSKKQFQLPSYQQQISGFISVGKNFTLFTSVSAKIFILYTSIIWFY